MITILIADDEKLERNGIKFLLKREQEELEILEAINGKDAAGILQKKQVDILFSDIKMPYMTGLELAKAARELQPEIEIVIFSGYNDFSYAKEALHYGVVDYVLKPVDPGEFHKTYCSVRDHILEKNTQKGEIARQQDDLGKYFLQNFLYDGKEENGTKAAELLCQDGGQYTHMILAGGEDCFFEVDEEKLLGQLREHMSRQFLYLNVAANESLFLFQERYADYETVAKELYQFFKNKYDEECYLAVSEEITDWQELPEVFSGLEEVLAEKFYQPRQKIFFAGEVQETAKRGHVTVLEVVTCEKENLSADAMVFLEQSMDGLIVIGELYQEYMKMLRKVSRIPIVCVDYYDVYDDMDYIITDGFGGMEQMTRLLLKEGYRDLIFVGSPNATKNITDRYFGYCKAMQRAGMEEEQFRFVADRECGKGNYRLEIELPEKLPQGFVCNCDKTAVLLLERLKERGVRVPEDVSVVSFDNYYPQVQDGVKLCTYENDEKVIARISVSTLLKRIEGKSRPEGVRIVEGRIVPGNTVRFRGDC